MSITGMAEDADLLVKFTALLASPDPIALPRQTLLGAVSHYISTLPLADLRPLLKVVIQSPHLWDDVNNHGDSRAAVKLGARGALDRLTSTPGTSRWFRRNNSLSDWLDEAYETIAETEGGGKLHVMMALLAVDPATGAEQGKAQLWKGKERAKAEDEVIMGVAERLHETEKGERGKADVGLLCEVLEAVDGMRVRVLDTNVSSRFLPSLCHPLNSRLYHGSYCPACTCRSRTRRAQWPVHPIASARRRSVELLLDCLGSWMMAMTTRGAKAGTR
jgi:hypothetical protein